MMTTVAPDLTSRNTQLTVALLSAHATAIWFLAVGRLIFGPTTILWFLTNALMLAQLSLVSLWLVFGRCQLRWRVVGMVSFLACMQLLLYLDTLGVDLYGNDLVSVVRNHLLHTALFAAAVLLPLMVARHSGWMIRRVPGPSAPSIPAGKAFPTQPFIAGWGIFFAYLIVCWVFGGPLVYFQPVEPLLALTVLVAAWAVLAPGRSRRRIALLCAFIVVLAFVAELCEVLFPEQVFVRENDQLVALRPQRSFRVDTLLLLFWQFLVIAAIVAGSLAVVRRMGYHWISR